MYADYVSRVVEKYHQKRKSNTLSQRLIHPSPAQLKEECIDRYETNFERKDENTLRVFFRHTGTIDTLGQSIETFGIGKFKALSNFLVGKTIGTERRNIELLAWLIDFEPRPFVLGRKYDADSDNQEKDKVEVIVLPRTLLDTSDVSKTSIQEVKPPQPGKSTNKKRFLLLLIPVLLFGFFGYKWGRGNKFETNMSGKGTCMYWTGDHYESVPCKQSGNNLVIAADSARIHKFKRVLKTDTITERSVGNLWYRKKNNVVEVYTDSGYHPVDMHVKLKVLSRYMFDKYFRKKDQ